VEQVKVDNVMDGAMRGLVEGLDADSAYLTPAEVSLVEKSVPLPSGDPGVDVTRQYYLRVVSARDGSPAAKAGLRTGDYVRAIDGKPTRDMSVLEGLRLLHGPVGSTVTLTVLRGSAVEPHQVELVREKLTPPAMMSRMATPGVGLVRIGSFDAATPADLRKNAEELRKGGASHLLLDLRGTSTGTAAAAVEAARLFVPSGTLSQREVRGQSPQPTAAAKGDGSITVPVTLLTTAGTSGPAEIFVAALAGNNRASIVGERTLGRASEQKLIRLPDGSGLWLTAVRFLKPDGKPITGQGIEPTVAVEDPDVEFGAEPSTSDPILEKALEEAGQKRAA
jgi:carboxyl-terminal processing protease